MIALTIGEYRWSQLEQQDEEVKGLRAVKARVDQFRDEIKAMKSKDISSVSLDNAVQAILNGFHHTSSGLFFSNPDELTDAQRIAKRFSEFNQLLQFPASPFSWEHAKLLFLGEINQIFSDVAYGREPVDELFQKLVEGMIPKPKIWQQKIADMKKKIGI